MFIIRRSRGILLLVSMVVFNLIALSLFQFTPIDDYVIGNKYIDNIKQLLINYQPDSPSSLFSSWSLSNDAGFALSMNHDKEIAFHNQVASAADNHESTNELYNQLDSTTVKASQFNVIDIPNDIPLAYQPFDPRFTLGLILNYINEQENKDLELPSFHWSDFVDMSPLEDQFFHDENDIENYQKKKLNCKDFDATKKNPRINQKNMLFPTKEYCIDDDEIDNILNDQEQLSSYDSYVVEQLKKIKQQNSPMSLGFHIFEFPGRNAKKYRPILGKAYVYEFMKNPSTLTMLLPTTNQEQQGFQMMYQMPVNQQNRNKISNSNQIFKLGVSIDLKQELNELITSNKPQKLTSLTYEKHLSHDMFVDNSPAIIMSMQQQLQTQPLNQTDTNYLNSLKFSLLYENPGKYFHEANILTREANFALGGHYDWRFMNGIINNTPQLSVSINQLIKSWFRLTNQFGLNTWIAHGSLLSWYWNGLQFPWDSDIDVQMPILDLHKLSRYLNQSVIVDFGHDINNIRLGRYFLDCSSLISQRVRGNGNNNIDARFIDMDTGLYIDITGLALSNTMAPARYNHLLHSSPNNGELARENSRDATISELARNEFLQVYNCRNNHFSRLEELSPIRLSLVEGEFGYIPNEFESILKIEYNEKSINNKDYNGFVFLPKLRIWVKKKPIVNFVAAKEEKEQQQKPNQSSKKTADVITIDLTDEEYSQYLLENQSELISYLITSNVTLFHQDELVHYFNGRSAKSLFFTDEESQQVQEELQSQLILKKGLIQDLSQDLFKFNSFQSNYNYADKLNKIKLLLGEKQQQQNNDDSNSKNSSGDNDDPLNRNEIVNEIN